MPAEKIAPKPVESNAPADLGKLGLKSALKRFSAESRQSRRTQKDEARRHADMEREFKLIDGSKRVIGQAIAAAGKIKKHDFDAEPLAAFSFRPFGMGSLENIPELTLSELTGTESPITRLIDEDFRNIMNINAREPYWKIDHIIDKGRKEIAYVAKPAVPDESYDAHLLVVSGPEFESGTLLVAPAGSDVDFYGVATEIATQRYGQGQKDAVVNGLSEV